MTSVVDVWGLQPALDKKSDADHRHRISDVEGLAESLAEVVRSGENAPIYPGDVIGLIDALDSKAALNHSHSIDAITGLQILLSATVSQSIFATTVNLLESEIISKATQDDLTGLQTALNGKAALSHTHANATSSAAGFMSAADKAKLDGLSTTTGPVTVAISDVTGLQTALDGKAALSHTHANATSSAAGFMSATDKAKLDGLGSSAPSDPALLTYTISQSTVRYGCVATYANMTDNDINTGGGTNYSATGEWIMADLGSLKTFSRVTLSGGNVSGSGGNWGAAAYYLQTARLECSSDGTTWGVMPANLALVTDTAPTLYSLGNTVARYVRIFVKNYLATTEFKIYG